ncbi:conserved hypothetical protein [Paraburkholderia tropica]
MKFDTTAILSAHLTATRALLEAGLAQMKVEDPAQYANVALVARNGGMFKIETGLSTAGLFEVNVALVDASGESVTLMHTETGVVNH